MRDDKRGFVDVLDDVRDSERLARTRDAKQRLMLRAGDNAGGQLFDGLWLVAGGRVIGDEFEHATKIDGNHAVSNCAEREVETGFIFREYQSFQI